MIGTFCSIYSPGRLGKEVVAYKNIYPSGIAFVLVRAGKSNLVQKIFEGWRSEEESVISEVFVFAKYLEQEYLDEDTVKYIYNQKLQEPNVDVFLRQCYLILLKINEIEDIFETLDFPQDEELHFWLTLKTTYVDHTQLPDYLQSDNTLYTHMSLHTLQNEAPETTGYIEDIYLQRYDNVLHKLSKRYEINHELPLLMVILRECGCIRTFEDIEMNLRCVGQLGGLIYQENPIVGTILLRLGDCHDGMLVEQVGQLLVRSNVIEKLLSDRKLKCQLEEVGLSKDEELIRQVYDKMTFEFFRLELHKQFKRFATSLMENTFVGYVSIHTSQF